MDTKWLLANWMILAGAGGVAVVLIAIVSLLARPKVAAATKTSSKPHEAPRPQKVERSPVAPAQAAKTTASLSVDLTYQAGAEITGGWRTLQGTIVAAGSEGLKLLPGANAISVQSAPVQSGDDFICDYEVRLVKLATNGAPVNFYVGAVLRDASGAVVGYWVEQKAFAPGETVRKGRAYATAPAGAATVHIGAHGPWLANGRHGDGEVEFTAIHVRSKR